MITKQQFVDKILPVTLKNEKGYSNNKSDRGGETYAGISRRSNPYWPGWEILKKAMPLRSGDIVNLPGLKDAIANLYWEKYFEGENFHLLNSLYVASNLFDFKVNGGLSIRKLQAELNKRTESGLKVDGQFGQKTAAALDASPSVAGGAIYALRCDHCADIVEGDQSQAIFENGWKNRVKGMLNLKIA